VSDEFDDDLLRYDEARGPRRKALDNGALLRPIADLPYPRDPASVAPGVPVAAVLATMAEKRMGAMLVEEDGKVTGIFSERDALVKSLWKPGADLRRPVRDFMTPNPECLTPHDSIAFALNRMAEGGFRHIPLVDAARRPVGVLVMRDVVRHLVSYFPAEVLNLPPHAEHAPPDRHVDGG
jgi:CBS domain-containing protein